MQKNLENIQELSGLSMIHAYQKADILAFMLRLPAPDPTARCFQKLCQQSSPVSISVYSWQMDVHPANVV